MVQRVYCLGLPHCGSVRLTAQAGGSMSVVDPVDRPNSWLREARRGYLEMSPIEGSPHDARRGYI